MRFVYLLVQGHAGRFGTVSHTAFIRSRRECIGNGGSASIYPNAATLACIGERILKYPQARAWTFC